MGSVGQRNIPIGLSAIYQIPIDRNGFTHRVWTTGVLFLCNVMLLEVASLNVMLYNINTNQI